MFANMMRLTSSNKADAFQGQVKAKKGQRQPPPSCQRHVSFSVYVLLCSQLFESFSADCFTAILKILLCKIVAR